MRTIRCTISQFNPSSRRMSCLPRQLFLFAFLLALLSPAHAEDDFLAPNVAFQFSARMVDPTTVEATWRIAEGYYMYREQFKFTAAGARLGKPDIPPGKVKFDETFNKDVETYRHRVAIRMPVEAAAPFTLTATGQGCSDKGLCYSPQDATAQLSPAAGTVVAQRPAGAFDLPLMSRPGDPVMEVPAEAAPIQAVATPREALLPVTPGMMQMAGLTLFGIALGTYLLRRYKGWAIRAVAIVLIGFGIVQMIGFATGARDPLAPFARIPGFPTGP